MTRFLTAGNIRLLVAVCIVLLTPLSARGETPIVSDMQTEFSLDGKKWSPAIATWVHPSWPSLAGATWIWTSYLVSGQEAVHGSPIVKFRRNFTLSSKVPARGTLQITADNAYRASFNGRLIGSNGVLDASSNADQQWHTFDTYAIDLRPGDNELIVEAINYHWPYGESAGPQDNPGGIIFSLPVVGGEKVAQGGRWPQEGP